jgi:hypothetical protein
MTSEIETLNVKKKKRLYLGASRPFKIKEALIVTGQFLLI